MKILDNSTIDMLTNRELELVKLLSEGLSRRDIADKMAMSIHTYDSYRKNIRNKLKLKNQADWAVLLVSVSMSTDDNNGVDKAA